MGYRATREARALSSASSHLTAPPHIWQPATALLEYAPTEAGSRADCKPEAPLVSPRAARGGLSSLRRRQEAAENSESESGSESGSGSGSGSERGSESERTAEATEASLGL